MNSETEHTQEPQAAISPALPVLRLSDIHPQQLLELLSKFGMVLEVTPDKQAIPGSYWGDDEAGLVENRLLARGDTPLHSILHEACHFVCMDSDRRSALNTDASGDYDEENAVCYLQILLSDHLEALGRQRMFQDMDAWGYSFRLGSARAWFEQDAQDARQWLIQYGLIGETANPSFQLRK